MTLVSSLLSLGLSSEIASPFLTFSNTGLQNLDLNYLNNLLPDTIDSEGKIGQLKRACTLF